MDETPMGPEGLIEDSGESLSPSEALPTQNTLKALSDSLSAPVRASSPLHILGEELYEKVEGEMFSRKRGQSASDNSGMIYNPNYSLPSSFLFRDPKARAWYVFQAIVGLTYPCGFDQIKRNQLKQGFERGWADGSLSFLPEVLLEDIGVYRERL